MTFRIALAFKGRAWELERALGAEGARVTPIDDVIKGLRANPGPFDVAIFDGTLRSLALDWGIAELKRRVPGVRLFTVGGVRRPDAQHLETLPDPAGFARELYGRSPPTLDFEELGPRTDARPLFEVRARLDGEEVDVVATSDEELFETFESLAVPLATVPRSPGLPPLVKLGRDEERSWAAFAPAPHGVALQSLLRVLRHERRPLSPAALSWVGVQACSVLELLHAHGMCHGWVRPGAVWLADGDAEVSLRFPSIGVLIERDRRVQRRGAIGLAPRRDDLAPETETSRTETSATDVFQLGHVLYEAASTHSAFLQRPHDRPLPALSAPLELARAIEQMLSGEPKDRPAVHEVNAVLLRHADEAAARAELGDARRRLRALLQV